MMFTPGSRKSSSLLRQAIATFTVFSLWTSSAIGGPEEDRLKAAKRQCALSFAVMVGAGLWAGGQALLGLLAGGGNGGPPGEEHPVLEEPSDIMAEESVFEPPSFDEETSSEDFDSSFVKDREKLELVPWKTFPSHAASEENAKVPARLMSVLNTYMEHALDNAVEEMWEALPAKYHDLNYLKTLSAKEMVELSLAEVKRRLQYKQIKFDHDTATSMAHWHKGHGDCDKYTHLVGLMYYALKKHSGNKEAVFLFGEEFASESHRPANQMQNRGIDIRGGHSWLSAISVNEEGQWKVSQLDPTFSDSSTFKGDDAYDLDHVDKNLWRYYFLKGAKSYKNVIREFLYDDLGREKDTARYEAKMRVVVHALNEMKAWDQLRDLEKYHLRPEIPNKASTFRRALMEEMYDFQLAAYRKSARYEGRYMDWAKNQDWDAFRAEIEMLARNYERLPTNDPFLSFLYRLKDGKGAELLNFYEDKLREVREERRERQFRNPSLPRQ